MLHESLHFSKSWRAIVLSGCVVFIVFIAFVATKNYISHHSVWLHSPKNLHGLHCLHWLHWPSIGTAASCTNANFLQVHAFKKLHSITACCCILLQLCNPFHCLILQDRLHTAGRFKGFKILHFQWSPEAAKLCAFCNNCKVLQGILQASLLIFINFFSLRFFIFYAFFIFDNIIVFFISFYNYRGIKLIILNMTASFISCFNHTSINLTFSTSFFCS